LICWLTLLAVGVPADSSDSLDARIRRLAEIERGYRLEVVADKPDRLALRWRNDVLRKADDPIVRPRFWIVLPDRRASADAPTSETLPRIIVKSAHWRVHDGLDNSRIANDGAKGTGPIDGQVRILPVGRWRDYELAVLEVHALAPPIRRADTPVGLDFLSELLSAEFELEYDGEAPSELKSPQGMGEASARSFLTPTLLNPERLGEISPWPTATASPRGLFADTMLATGELAFAEDVLAEPLQQWANAQGRRLGIMPWSGVASAAGGEMTAALEMLSEELNSLPTSKRPWRIWFVGQGLSAASDAFTVRYNKAPSWMAVGGLPVRTADEFAAWSQKATAYATTAEIGPWLLNHLLVPDDTANHADAARQLMAGPLARLAVPRLIDLGLLPFSPAPDDPKRLIAKPAADILMKSMEENGALTVALGTTVTPSEWSTRGLMTFDRLGDLKNSGRPTILFMPAEADVSTEANLLNGWLTIPDGGAVGALRLADPSGAYAGLLEDGHRLLGDIDLAADFDAVAREAVRAPWPEHDWKLPESATDDLAHRTMLGDPGLAIPLPVSGMGRLQFTPPFVDSIEGGSTELRGELDQPIWGWADVALVDDGSGRTLHRSTLRVRQGRFGGVIPISPNTPAGRVGVTVLVYNAGRRLGYLLESQLDIGPPVLRWDNPLSFVALQSKDKNRPIQLQFQLTNPYPINFDGATIRLTREGMGTPIFERRFPFPANATRPVDVRWIADQGVYSLALEIETGPKDSEKIRHDFVIMAYDDGRPADLAVASATLKVEPKVMTAGKGLTVIGGVYNAGGTDTADGMSVKAVTAELVDGRDGKRISDIVESAPPLSGKYTQFAVTTKNVIYDYGMPVTLKVGTVTNSGKGPVAEVPLSVQWARGADLSVVPGSVRFVGETFEPGHSLFIEAEVTNVGDAPSESFTVAAFRDEAFAEDKKTTSMVVARQSVESPLEPEEKRRVIVRWDDTEKATSEQRIYVTVTPVEGKNEASTANNSAVGIVRFGEQQQVDAPDAEPAS